MAETIEIEKHTIELSNSDKKIYQKSDITKGDIIDYYEKIAEYMLPFLKDRPLMLQRFPDGMDKGGFYQKDRPDYFPDWIDSSEIKKKEGGKVDHVLCNDKATLVYLANQACITFHGWLSLADKPDKPDKIVIDIDPSGEDLSQLREGMKLLHTYFEESGFITFPMTTGSSGYHIVIPIVVDKNFDAVKKIANNIAGELAEKYPEKFTTAARKNKRGSAIYLDVQRNAYAQTSVIPFSLRAKENAPIATPLEWEEAISSKTSPQKYNIHNIMKRVGQVKDVWTKYTHKSTMNKNISVLEKWS